MTALFMPLAGKHMNRPIFLFTACRIIRGVFIPGNQGFRVRYHDHRTSGAEGGPFHGTAGIPFIFLNAAEDKRTAGLIIITGH